MSQKKCTLFDEMCDGFDEKSLDGLLNKFKGVVNWGFFVFFYFLFFYILLLLYHQIRSSQNFMIHYAYFLRVPIHSKLFV